MKDKLKIEELFKEKFSSFEGNVPPDAWANIQQGMGAGGATGATAGMSAALKGVIVAAGVAVVAVTSVYIATNTTADEKTIAPQEKVVTAPVETTINEAAQADELIYVLDENDPVIEENRTEIERDIQENNPTAENSIDHTQNATPQNNSVNTSNGNGGMDNEPKGNGTHTAVAGNDDPNKPTVENNESPVNNADADKSTNTADATDNTTTNDEDQLSQTVKQPDGQLTFTSEDEFAPKTFNFSANSKNATTVRWDFGNGEFAIGEKATVTYAKPGKYTVKMAVFGETDVYEEQTVIVVKSKSRIEEVPNVITPNGDGINDQFSIESYELETFYIIIQNERGHKLFESSKADFTWNGTDLGGNKLDVGRYTYVIIATGTDGSEHKLSGQLYIRL